MDRVGLVAIDQQVNVLGSPDDAMGRQREATDQREPGPRSGQRADEFLKLSRDPRPVQHSGHATTAPAAGRFPFPAASPILPGEGAA